MTPEHIARVEAVETRSMRIREMYDPTRHTAAAAYYDDHIGAERGEEIGTWFVLAILAMFTLAAFVFLIASLAGLPLPMLIVALLVAVVLK